jgi:hypothetical protein
VSGKNQVTVHDFEDSGEICLLYYLVSTRPCPSNYLQAVPMADIFFETDGKEPFILATDYQVDVKAVQWRPNSGKMIAVGCRFVLYNTLTLTLHYCHVNNNTLHNLL